MKKLLMCFFVISLSFGFVFAEEEEENEMDSVFKNTYIELGFETSFKLYDDEEKNFEKYISLFFNRNFIIDINKYFRFLPAIEFAVHYGLADYQKLGFSGQLGFALEREQDDWLTGWRMRVRIEPYIGFGILPVNYRPKLNFGSILGFRFGIYIGDFGLMFGYRDYLIEGEDINTITSLGIKWSFR